MRCDDPIEKPAGDSGVAMILVIIMSMVMLGLALVVAQSVVRQIVPSSRSEHSFAALSAAEAGIAEYLAHLQENNIYYSDMEDQDCVADVAQEGFNAALCGWVDVPGGTTDSEFRYSVDSSRAGAGGMLVVIAVGRSPKGENGVVRTVQATLSKRSTLDYVYMSDIETPAPDLPGAYSTVADSGGPGYTAQELARLVCSRHWYEGGQVQPLLPNTGNQRNLNFCQWAGIYNSETLQGKVHTNDVWRLENADLTDTIAPGDITSSCRSEAEGLLPGEVGCDEDRRFLANSPTGITSNNGTNAKWIQTSTSRTTLFQGNAWRPDGPPDPTGINPEYATILDLPTSPALLKKRASETGCVFTGPTRIRFTNDGYMYVTSPDTKATNPLCAGGNGAFLGTGTATAPNTARVNLASFEDLVIYVQNVRRPTEADDPDNAWDLNNQFATVTPPTAPNEPTCKVKFGTSTYPFVIPKASVDTGEAALFNSPSGWHFKGYPSEYADIASPWYSSSCAKGDLYVQGVYKGAMTIATENNIILTGTLRDTTSSTTTGANYGKPSSTSQNFLGLVSDKFSYIYRPFTAAPARWVGDWKIANARNPIFNFALLAVDQCFAAQDPYTPNEPNDPTYGDRNGYIYMWGSLAQKYRCVVGSNGGYNKVYKYDTRLARHVPPYMLELSDEAWTDSVENDSDRKAPTMELTMQRQGLDVAAYPLAFATDVSATVDDVEVVSGAASVTTSGLTAYVTPTAPGPVIVSYDLTHGTGDDAVTEFRRLVIWVE